jgi:1,2-diacylglycerol 3-alpha-glucosyltransferase
MNSQSLSLRVLMLSDVYFPRVNGVSTSIQTFRNDLATLGCDSVLVAPRYPSTRADEDGIVRVRSRYLPFDPEDRLMVARDLERTCTTLARDCDLVHVQTPFAAHRTGVRVARRLGLPVLETYHTYFEQYFHHYLRMLPRAPLSWLARLISRSQCNAVDAVVAPSQPMADVLVAYGVSTPIEVVPTGLDLRKFARGNGARFRTELGIAPARPVILSVGRVAFEKNLRFLIDVLERVRCSIPDVLLVIAGEGPALGALRREVAARGLVPNVLFVGYLDRGGGLLDCYCSADVFVFASRTETQGLVLLEAMALGIPVVSTAIMGSAAVLEGAQGAVTVDDHLPAFASAVAELLRSPRRRAELGVQAARFVAEHWSSLEMARRMEDLYRRCVRRSAISSLPDRDLADRES